MEADEQFSYTQQVFVRVGDTEFDSSPFVRNTPVEDEEKNICPENFVAVGRKEKTPLLFSGHRVIGWFVPLYSVALWQELIKTQRLEPLGEVLC